ncbi:hypothetical protein D9M71_704310 [compost metagenome]
MPFTDSAARCITCTPTALLPVKETLATFGWDDSGAPTARPVPHTRLNTPAGRPLSWMMRASSSSGSGVTSEGLSTTVQPAARAGASFQAVVTMGKFHGTISPTTPTGSRRKRAAKSSLGSSTARSCWVSRPSARPA